MAMNELDREMELAERAERRDDLMQRRQLLQKQRQAERRQKDSARKVRRGICGAQPRAAVMSEGMTCTLEQPAIPCVAWLTPSIILHMCRVPNDE